MSRSSATPIRLLRMPLREQQDVVLCRQRARAIAGMVGVESAEQVRIATAVSEIARNAVEYAQAGLAEFSLELPAGNFVITVSDCGPGIASLEEILGGTYRSPTGLGCGITGARRLMDALEIGTGAQGTTVRLVKQLRAAASSALTTSELRRITEEIAKFEPSKPLDELALQNRELIRALQELQAQKDELERRTQDLGQMAGELAETNRGVLALYDELDSLHRLSRVISAQLDLDSLLSAIIEATTDLCGAEMGVFLYGIDGEGRFRSQVSAGALQDLGSRFLATTARELFGMSEIPSDVLRIGDLIADERVFSAASDCALRSYLAVPVFRADATLLGVIAFGHRVPDRFTERNERILGAVALQAAVGMENARLYTSLQSASAAKDHFLATLSHELRTPLNPIFLILSELVLEPRLDADIKAQLQIVHRNLHLEARLIDDLLDMTRIVQGKIHLRSEPVAMHEVARAAIETCLPQNQDKQIDFQSHLRAERDNVTGDSARLQQVLWNLLNNAMKFTPEGGRITLTTENPPGSHCIRIAVSDTGRGIDGPMLKRIFYAFDQGDVAGTSEYGGLGLGLAISKNIVDAHRGEISASSAGRDHGATFTLDLPLSAVAISVSAGTKEAALPARPAPLRILLVDDHADTLSVLRRVLTRRGHTVFAASTAEAAVELASRESLDLLISDIGLPDRSGLELMAELQKARRICGIALSGYGADADIERSRAAGFIGHLTKPVEIPALEKLIAEVGLLGSGSSDSAPA
jgi:signal transduction histidine kinase/CheY-like chemotaxis protein